MSDYMPVLIDTRNVWQRSYETEVGSVVQNDPEFIRKEYITDYTSIANRDIMVYEEGSYIQRYVYGLNGERTSAEFFYYDETERTGNLTNPGKTLQLLVYIQKFIVKGYGVFSIRITEV